MQPGGVGPSGRRRVRYVNPNALFSKWLREWRDEAASKGSHAKITYAKALNSLAKFPLPLETGQDCKILQHFGQGICDMLDQKLAEHRRLHPNWTPQHLIEDLPKGNQPRNVADKVTLKRRSGQSGTTPADKISVNSEVVPSSTSSKQSKPKKAHPALAKMRIKTKSRPAVEDPKAIEQPAPENVLPEDGGRKPEVIDLRMDSPDYKADSDDDSFLVPLSKRLVHPKVVPQRQLSEVDLHQEKVEKAKTARIEVVDLLDEDSSDGDGCVDEPGDVAEGNISTVEERLASLKKLVSPVIVRAPLELPPAKTFDPIADLLSQGDSFCPARTDLPQESVLDLTAEIRMKRSSLLAHLDEDSQPVRARFVLPDMHETLPVSQIEERIPIDSEDPADVRTGPFLASEPNPAKEAVVSLPCPAPPKETLVAEPPTVIAISPEPALHCPEPTNVRHCLSDSDEDDLPPLAVRVQGPVDRQVKVVTVEALSEEPDSFAALVEQIATPPFERTRQDQSGKSTENAPIGKPGHQLKVSRKKTKNCESAITATTVAAIAEPQQRTKRGRHKKDKVETAPSLPETAPIRLQYIPEGSCQPQTVFPGRTSRCPLAVEMKPGTFEVVLCVDSCEASGGVMSKKKEAMIEALRSSGVPMDIRKMNVGDFAWVAKGPSEHELVLDCIVERKRADDLASSIKDGRYREQKHRLVASGIRRKIYLVEEYARFAAGGISDHSLLQAQLNTQVVNDFVIRQTKNVKESAAYLVELTRALSRRYSGRTLKSCLRDEVGSLDNDHLMSWSEFNESSTKRRKICMKQAYTRALMVIKGMSLEKALCVVAVHPTIVSLLTAYEQCESLAQKESLLANLRCALSGRRLGPALSKAVHRFIWGEAMTREEDAEG